MTGLRDEMEAIRSTYGDLTPAVVVAAATPDDHPLHHRFEWDDKIAGPKYREMQAAALIRVVHITYRKGDEERKVRAYQAIPSEESPACRYEPTEEVLEDPFRRQLVLTNMEREWKSLRRRYEHLAEFASMIRKDLDAA